MKNHDPYCKSHYPALIDPEKCTWCYVIRQVRIDEYLQAWNEGYEIGFGEGKQKKEEDVDTASWQGYNNAMVDTLEDDNNE